MNQLVFMILFAEREMEIQRQKDRDTVQDSETKIMEPTRRSKRKSRKGDQKACECWGDGLRPA